MFCFLLFPPQSLFAGVSWLLTKWDMTLFVGQRKMLYKVHRNTIKFWGRWLERMPGDRGPLQLSHLPDTIPFPPTPHKWTPSPSEKLLLSKTPCPLSMQGNHSSDLIFLGGSEASHNVACPSSWQHFLLFTSTTPLDLSFLLYWLPASGPHPVLLYSPNTWEAQGLLV